jgi:hypothetical protein
MTTIEVVVSIVTGVLSSLVASGVWLFGLRKIRPRIDVSPVIAQDFAQVPDATPTSAIKIINRARRAAVEVQFELALINSARTKGGPVFVREPLVIDNPPPMVLPRSPRNRDSKAHEESYNAFRLRTKCNARLLLEEHPNSYLRLRVFARDELSGIGRVFEASYHEPESDVEIGKFARGQTFEVVRTAAPNGGPQVSTRPDFSAPGELDAAADSSASRQGSRKRLFPTRFSSTMRFSAS